MSMKSGRKNIGPLELTWSWYFRYLDVKVRNYVTRLFIGDGFRLCSHREGCAYSIRVGWLGMVGGRE